MTLIKTHRNEFPVFGDVMANLFEDRFFRPAKSWTTRSTPQVNITEDDNGYAIELAAPGMEKEAFQIDLKEKILTISAVNKAEKEETNSNKKYTLKEFSYSEFKRSFNLPKNADSENINAAYVDGVLTVNIPKTEPQKDLTKKITIK